MFTNIGDMHVLFPPWLHVYTTHHVVPHDTGVDCGPPESPAQGTTNYTATEYGVEAQYSCNTGCVLSGARTTVCTVDGTWSHPPPTCSSKLVPDVNLFVTGFLK